jgi:hypothetical protein
MDELAWSSCFRYSAAALLSCERCGSPDAETATRGGGGAWLRRQYGPVVGTRLGWIDMTISSVNLLLWSPRLLGVGVALFLGVFATDAFAEGMPEFLLHAAPALVLLAVVAISWRWQWIGSAVFVTLAVLYAVTTWRRPDWVLLISGPLFVVGALYFWSWRRHRELHPQS